MTDDPALVAQVLLDGSAVPDPAPATAGDQAAGDQPAEGRAAESQPQEG
jgi:hypothetical protein